MFATFFLERDPMSWADLPLAVQSWLQNAGGVAALAVALWCISWTVQNRGRVNPFAAYPAFVVPAALAGVCYLIVVLLFAGKVLGMSFVDDLLPTTAGALRASAGDWLLTLGGLLALAAVVGPIAHAFAMRIRWGRIWAIARLSVKEAVRNRVVLLFAAMAIVFLFADWFVPYKPEDQVRNYVRVVYWSMTPLFLMTASLLGAFSIPTDVKSQSIHTIVTKPVEKFEIVAGRFLGYATLLSVGLAAVAGLSLIYVVRGVNPDAARESYKARVPIYGQLTFSGTKSMYEGESVGREWGYRWYIGGPVLESAKMPRQYAIWSFADLPRDMARVDETSSEDPKLRSVPFEFTFDIFRLNKGEENKGIYCTFVFMDGRLSIPDLERVQKAAYEERSQLQTKASTQIADPSERQKRLKAIDEELVRKYGLFEAPGFEVTDYHTQTLRVPSHLFERLAELEKERPREGLPGEEAPPMMRVVVSVDHTSPTQMLGVARRDLYILAAEQPFWINFLKGILGMWCTVLLVLGVAIGCSTYLSGIISWLCTVFLFGAGLFKDSIRQLAEGQSPGGGPLESAYRVFTRTSQGAPLDQSPTASLLQGGDDVYRWWMRRFLNLIPDVSRHDLHQYVANGFDISWGQVLLTDNLIPLVGYLLPWGILAFYLMKFREIANPR
ncbi:MAG: ABC transporter permease [Gemmataceae bacterium]|nr:ABC transporter permease [Gemmataceae bacterium]MCI0742737.1 ABC transporter permease [Gemmataceae bacterium]